MRYISVCSGIEAASVAWEPLGWEPVAFAEIDAFPSAVLAHRFPNVPNLGDISKVDWRPYHGTVDLVVGGTPCQSFSIAGRREGLDGASGLVFEYFRLLSEVRPRWFVWENVPGSFSSNKGADFQSILREWDKLGYHVAWRVLDAQFFGVPQRRRRIFAVGHLGDWRHPAKVLFEPDCLRGNTQKGGKARKGSAATAESGVAKCLSFSNQRLDGETETFIPVAIDYELNASLGSEPCGPLLKGSPSGGGNPLPAVCCQYGDKAGALTARHDSSPCADRGMTIVGTLAASGAGTSRPAGQGNELDFLVPTYAFKQGAGAKAGGIGWDRVKAPTLTSGQSGTQLSPAILTAPTLMRMRSGCEGGGKGALLSEDRALTLATGNDQVLFEPTVELMPRMAVRRLTPTECERLQGFPDGWTDIPWRGKDHAPDGPRYKALGNSMAVPCMRWIGERIAKIELEGARHALS